MKFDVLISSQIEAVRSKEQVAITWPYSGWAQVTFHTDPLWAFHAADKIQFPCSSWSQIYEHIDGINGFDWKNDKAVFEITLTNWSLEHVAIRFP